MSIIYVHIRTEHPKAEHQNLWFRTDSEARGQSDAQRRVTQLQTEFSRLNPEDTPPVYKVTCYDEFDFEMLPASVMLTMPGLMYAKLIHQMATGTLDTTTLLGRRVNKHVPIEGSHVDCGA